MGQTGAGKTTFVNALVNFILGIDYNDKFRYVIVDERDLIAERTKRKQEAISSGGEHIARIAQVHSMTSTVNIYHLPHDQIKVPIAFNNMNCCLNIIDTPGFGDTRGEEWDKKIGYMIQSTLLKLSTLDYLVLVVKATENRLAS